MRTRLLVLAALSLGVAAGASARNAHDLRRESLASQLDDAIRRTWHPDGPGATVLVSRERTPILRKAYGHANLEHGIALDPSMPMRIGSITKQFTAALVMQEVEAGRISLEDDITKHLPDWPAGGKRITVKQLLNHSSGIKSYTSLPDYPTRTMRKELTLDELLALFRDLPADFEPGTAWSYSNSGYVLLGAILEKATGKSYAELIQERIAEPLGLKSLRYGSHADIIPSRPAGYAGPKHEWRNADFLSMSQPYSAGALLCSVDDLERWTVALHEGRVVSKKSLQLMLRPTYIGDHEAPYGFGLGMGQVRGRQAYGHEGGIPGFAAFAHYLPREKLFVAVLSNDTGNPSSPGFVAATLTGIAVGDPHESFEAVAVDARDLATYAGTYRLPTGEIRKVSVEGGKLYTQRGMGPKLEAKAHARHRFFYPGHFTHLEFTTSSAGTVTGMLVYRDGQDEPERSERIRGPVGGS